MTACAGGTGIGRPSNQYFRWNLTVTGSSGNLQQSMHLTLVVQ